MTAGGGGGGGEQNELIPEGLTYMYKCNIDIKKCITYLIPFLLLVFIKTVNHLNFFADFMLSDLKIHYWGTFTWSENAPT